MGIDGNVVAVAVGAVAAFDGTLDAFCCFHVKYHFLHLPNVPLSCWCSNSGDDDDDDDGVGGFDGFVIPLPLLMANRLCGRYERAFLFFSQSSKNESSYCGIAHIHTTHKHTHLLTETYNDVYLTMPGFNYLQTNEHQQQQHNQCQQQHHKYSD